MKVEPLYAEFGENLRRRRLGQGMSQLELANEVGMSRSSLSNIEGGRQRVYLDQCYSFAMALNLQSLELLIPVMSSLLPEEPLSAMPHIDSSQGLTDEEKNQLFERAYNV